MKRTKLKRPVLAEGEVTGHAHVLNTTGVDVYETGNGIREFEAMKEIPIIHEEHELISLPPSPTQEYRSGVVQEFDEFEQEARNVKD